MPVKFVDDGLPESADFDESFALVSAMRVAGGSSCEAHRPRYFFPRHAIEQFDAKMPHAASC